MQKQEIQRLRDLPIEQVAQRLGLQVERHKSLCPFHNDHHASLSYNTRKNTCRCFVCMDTSVNTIDLVMRQLRVDFPKACQWLADDNNIVLEQWQPSELRPPRPTVNQPKPFDAARYMPFFEHPCLSAEATRFLYDERRINPRVVERCRLTSWKDRDGTHWLQIPFYDQQGKLIGLQNRNLDYRKESPDTDTADATKQKQEKSRFRFPYGAKCSIYNLPETRHLQPGDELFITEGCSDCWAMLSAGRKAIAIPSATLLKPDDRQLLLSLGKVPQVAWYMYPDRDAPGERLFMQLKEILPQLQHRQLPPGCKDFGEAYLNWKKKQH